MNLINFNEPDCGPLADRLKRLPRKQLKFWIDNFPLNQLPPNSPYCNIHIKYGSVLSPPDGLTENIYNGWAALCNDDVSAETKYTGYVVNSYNSYLTEILAKFNINDLKIQNIPQLNYLLTNVNKYRAEGKTTSDIQTAI